MLLTIMNIQIKDGGWQRSSILVIAVFIRIYWQLNAEINISNLAFTFNDDGQIVQNARPELPAPHYICMYRLLPTTSLSPSRHFYPPLIAGTNLPNYITLPNVIT